MVQEARCDGIQNNGHECRNLLLIMDGKPGIPIPYESSDKIANKECSVLFLKCPKCGKMHAIKI
jgi:hypothetical protein